MIDPEIQFPDTPFPLDRSLTLLGRRGSEAHGTYLAPENPDSIDDRDLMGVCMPPIEWTLGLRHWEGAESIKGVWDVVLYDFRKFVRLLIKQNPNVIGMLWLEPEDYLHVGNLGSLLILSRSMFQSRFAAYQSFVGYAHSQLKKMKALEFRGYMGAKRKQLVERHGYDAKNAAHCVRLLHMGIEYLRTNEMHVRRTWDREMILDIKRGGWTLERVHRYADEKLSEMRDALEKSTMAETVDEDSVNALVVQCMVSQCRGGLP